MIPITQFSIKLNKDITIKGEYEGDEDTKKVIIFSHGFGVKRDSRGMFTDIGNQLKNQYLLIKFDYVDIDDENNSTTVFPFSIQVKILKKIISFVKDKFSPTEINIIAHSMGCLITGLLDPKDIKKIILLAPPADSSYIRMKEYFTRRKGTVINELGRSKIERSDGTWTYIDADFWPEVKSIDPKKLYINLARNSNVTIIRTTNDKLINKQIFSHIRNILGITYYEIETNHNFEEEGRNKLLRIIKSLL